MEKLFASVLSVGISFIIVHVHNATCHLRRGVHDVNRRNETSQSNFVNPFSTGGYTHPLHFESLTNITIFLILKCDF